MVRVRAVGSAVAACTVSRWVGGRPSMLKNTPWVSDRVCVLAACRQVQRRVSTLAPSANTTSPAVGAINCINSLAVVDLPQPDSPTRPSVSPRSMAKLRDRTAVAGPR